MRPRFGLGPYAGLVSISPSDELMLLLECAEDAFPMGRAADFRWHATRPGSSEFVDAVIMFEANGWVTLEEVRDPEDERLIMRAKLAPAGHQRIAEFVAAGVEPSEGVG